MSNVLMWWQWLNVAADAGVLTAGLVALLLAARAIRPAALAARWLFLGARPSGPLGFLQQAPGDLEAGLALGVRMAAWASVLGVGLWFFW